MPLTSKIIPYYRDGYTIVWMGAKFGIVFTDLIKSRYFRFHGDEDTPTFRCGVDSLIYTVKEMRNLVKSPKLYVHPDSYYIIESKASTAIGFVPPEYEAV